MATRKTAKKAKKPRTLRVVAAKPESGLSKKRAQVVCAEFDAMLAKGTRLIPRNIVRRAANPKSPLHQLFTWDDGLAAHNWRLDEARKLVASVQVTVVELDRTAREFYSVVVDVGGDGGGGRREYVHRDVVLNDTEKLATVHADRVARLVAIVRDAEAIGLARRYKFWSGLLEYVQRFDINGMARRSRA